MKLAEALIERAELKTKNAALLDRIQKNTLVQEGDAPGEEPAALIAEYEENMKRMEWLVVHINRTNSAAPFDDARTVTDAIAVRDCLGARIRAYRAVCDSACGEHIRYGRNEIKFVRCVDVKELQAVVDRLSKEYRTLDTRLQELNWTTELL